MTQQEQEFKELQEHIQYYKSKYGTVQNLSDGCHTYNELYEHRCRLFLALCKKFDNINAEFGMRYFFKTVEKANNDDYFLLAVIRDDFQISYHLPAKYYQEWLDFYRYSYTYLCINDDDIPSNLTITQKEWEKIYDGHTSEDVLERLKNL